jgi:glycosyltransferase involved in cell wall biosynthesis
MRRAISPVHDLLGLIELVRLFRRLRPQIVHLNSAKAGVLGRLAARLARVPVCVFTAHGWTFKASTGLTGQAYRMLDRAVRPLTTAIICVSETERRIGLAARTCTDAQAVVIPNAVDIAAAPTRTNDHSASPLRIVSVGRLADQKDFPTLVSAIALLPRGSVKLQVLGDGPQRPMLEQQIAKLGLGDVVQLAGAVGDVPERLAAADVFVLSSHYEGMPIAVLEAMAAGMPVVATDLDGIREMIPDEGARLLARPGDAGSLAAAIACLIDDPALVKSLGSSNRARVEDRFSLPRWREAHIALYKTLLAAKR